MDYREKLLLDGWANLCPEDESHSAVEGANAVSPRDKPFSEEVLKSENLEAVLHEAGWGLPNHVPGVEVIDQHQIEASNHSYGFSPSDKDETP